MKIKLHTVMAGPDGVRQPGEHEVGEEQGTDLVLSGHAVRLDGPVPAPIETAVDAAPENATDGPKRKKK